MYERVLKYKWLVLFCSFYKGKEDKEEGLGFIRVDESGRRCCREYGRGSIGFVGI